ncbi:MAG: site-specific DNA-methyltransferase [Armatimonadetes bacterium]|nr:site-specific DNA-methyltransferase [Armatimonadota bacterium]
MAVPFLDSGAHEGPADYLLILRRNIALDGDLMLARRELEAFFQTPVQNVETIHEGIMEGADGAGIQQFIPFDSCVRPEGVIGFRVSGPPALLPRLIRQVSFIQQILCVLPEHGGGRAWVEDLRREVGEVIVTREAEGKLVVSALPHYLLFELSEAVVRASSDGNEVRRKLQQLTDALLGHTADREAVALAQAVLISCRSTSPPLHGLHYFKAKFFPRMARSLINIGTGACEGERRILDSFAGSGTTLVEAATLGHDGVGVDVDPLAALISTAKLDLMGMESGFLEEEAENAILRLSCKAKVLNQTPPDAAMLFPEWMMRNRRMTGELAGSLASEIGALRCVVEGSAPEARNLLRVLMSDAICRKIRMRFLGTGVGRFSLTVGSRPLSRMFLQSLSHAAKAAAAGEWLRENLRLNPAPGQALVGDARRLPDRIGAFDLILTSPPYLPASSGRESYAKAHAPSLIALGMKDAGSVDALADGCMGAMEGDEPDFMELLQRERDAVEWLARDGLRRPKAGPTARYFLDMRRAFEEMHRALKPSARAVVVSGKQSTFYTFSTREPLYVVPCAEILAEEAEAAGFVLEALHDVQLQKANRNARPRSLDDYFETLIMLRKAGE